MTEKEALKAQAEVDRAFKMGYVKALTEEGVAPKAIASRIGISVSTVRAWQKKLAAPCCGSCEK